MMTKAALPDNFAMLNFGRLQLCFPQDQVLNIEIAEAIQTSSAVSYPAVGCLIHKGIEIPVFKLTEEFNLTTDRAEDCRVCVSFHIAGEPLLALACDTVEPIQLDANRLIRFLPEPMMSERTPVVKLFKWRDSLAYLSNAIAMSDFLDLTRDIDGGELSAQL